MLMTQIFQISCKKDQANSHMNKGLYNEKLKFHNQKHFNSNIVFGWVIQVGLMLITVDRVLSLAPSKFPKA